MGVGTGIRKRIHQPQLQSNPEPQLKSETHHRGKVPQAKAKPTSALSSKEELGGENGEPKPLIARLVQNYRIKWTGAII